MAHHQRVVTLAQRAAELRALLWPNTTQEFRRGTELRFYFTMAPSAMSRSYRCMLKVHRKHAPEMLVLEPDLKVLAREKPIPHIYSNASKGTKLCLWLPGNGEWHHNMPFDETLFPWTAEWLNYFEEWLTTGVWAGGGAHPNSGLKEQGPTRRGQVRIKDAPSTKT